MDLTPGKMSFKIAKLNRLEQMSILTAATTIYCGLLYLTERMGDEMKIFLFVLMAILNAIFLTSWLFGISDYMIYFCLPKIQK